LTVDNSLTLILEDLPPLTIGSGDLQIGWSSVIANVQRSVRLWLSLDGHSCWVKVELLVDFSCLFVDNSVWAHETNKSVSFSSLGFNVEWS
jgi:hypothetical protein